MLIIGGLDAQETVLLCLQDIAAGMACLHGLGVLHRCSVYCAPMRCFEPGTVRSLALARSPRGRSIGHGPARQTVAAGASDAIQPHKICMCLTLTMHVAKGLHSRLCWTRSSAASS